MFCVYPLKSFGKASKILVQLKKRIQLLNVFSFACCLKIIETNQTSAIIYSSKLMIKLENVQLVSFLKCITIQYYSAKAVKIFYPFLMI